MQPKRLGVIGCGKHGRSHIALALKLGWEVTALFDIKPESIDKAKQLISEDVAVCGSAEELVSRADVDVVLIASYDEHHPEQLRLALLAGKHVWCEKPLAITPEGMKIVNWAFDYARQHRLVIASCHPRQDRRNKDLPYGWLLDNLSALKQQFGRLKRLSLHSIYPRPSDEWKKNRSFLIDKCVHDINFIRVLLGDLSFTAQRWADDYDHYEVTGELVHDEGAIAFACSGTRLHGASEEFIELVTLSFEYGTCTVHTKTGEVRYWDSRTDKRWIGEISPIHGNEAYDRIFASLILDTQALLEQPNEAALAFADLRVINESVIALAGPRGTYRYGW